MSTTALDARTNRASFELRSRPSRAWATTGLVAGVAGVASIQASLMTGAVYDEAIAGDPPAIVARLAELTGPILAFHTLTMLCVVTLPVFAAGLRRRLRAGLPHGSLLPDVATAGLLLVAVAGLLGAGLTTEFVFGVQEAALVPETAVFFGHWIGTVPWLWVGAGISGLAVAVAALRHRALPRWIGWVSAVLGSVTLLFGVSPLQYMAGFTGPLWLVIVALGFLVGDRVRRAARGR